MYGVQLHRLIEHIFNYKTPFTDIATAIGYTFSILLNNCLQVMLLID